MEQEILKLFCAIFWLVEQTISAFFAVYDPHTCAKWKAQHRRYYPCRECNAPIYLDDSHLSKNGKHIPLSKETGEPHECEEVKAAQVS